MKRSINLSNVKAILFDYGGTLDNDGIPWKDRFYPIYAAHGFSWTFEEFENFSTPRTITSPKRNSSR